MYHDYHEPIICDEEKCNELAVNACLCNNTEYYLCKSHCIEHINTFSEIYHELNKIIPANPEVLWRLIDKSNWIIEETNVQIESCEREISKLKNHYTKVLENISSAGEMIINELQITIKTCKDLIEKAKKPILQKDWYNQLEFLLINDDLSYSNRIITQMKPPKIEDISKSNDEMWEKITFHSATFSHLLNDYNDYCLNVYDISNKEFRLTYFDGIKEEVYNDPLIEYASRIRLISPNDVLITGGKKNPRNCRIFSIKSQCPLPQNDLNHGRYWHCCTFIKGFPTVIGGSFNGEPIKTVESLKYGIWYDIASLNYPRSAASVSACFGKVYVAGGNAEHYCEVFDEATDKWEELPLRFYQRIGPGLICICESFILIFGGNPDPSIPWNDSIKVDTRNNKTSNLSPLEIKGKSSYSSHIFKDGKFFSFMDSNYESKYLEWELKQEINFRANEIS